MSKKREGKGGNSRKLGRRARKASRGGCKRVRGVLRIRTKSSRTLNVRGLGVWCEYFPIIQERGKVVA